MSNSLSLHKVSSIKLDAARDMDTFFYRNIIVEFDSGESFEIAMCAEKAENLVVSSE